MKGYHPEGMRMWDAWCIQNDDDVHLYHLQKKNPNSNRSDDDATALGHAVLKDLIHWQEMPPILPPNSYGMPDDLQAWTGCVCKHQDCFYLFYTMRSSLDDGKQQSIALANSSDLYHWTKYPGNPVLEPDAAYYVSKRFPLPNGNVDCRDFVVVARPDGSGWLGFYAARVPAVTVCSGQVIAVSQSDDLLHWQAMPPAFKPERFGVIEVPDVFYLDGRWYMTCLVDGRGARNMLTQPGSNCGTIYAVADAIEGPYRLLSDYILMEGPIAYSNFSLRSFQYNTERLAICIEREPGDRTLSPVMRFFTTPDGWLRIGYSTITQAYRERMLINPQIPLPLVAYPLHEQFGLPGGTWQLNDRKYIGWADGWQIGLLDASCQDVELEAGLKLVSGAAAGLTWGEWAFLIDSEREEVFAGRLPDFSEVYCRKWAIRVHTQYHLRIRIRRPRVEFYLDDALVLQFCASFSAESGRIGMLVDRARVVIEKVGAYVL